MSDLDLTFVETTVQALGRERRSVIPILQAIQSHYHYLPQEALERVCELTEITPATIAGVSTFYMQFRHQPVGKHVIQVCHGTACHVKHAGLVHDALLNHLKMKEGDETSADGLFTIQKVACLGCCTLAPVVAIDGVTYGHLTPRKIPGVLHDFLERQKKSGRRDAKARGAVRTDGKDGRAEIRIGLGSCCVAGGSAQVEEALKRAVAETAAPAVVKRVGCVGMCHQTPLVQVSFGGQPVSFYSRMGPAEARKLVLRHFKPRGLVRKLTQAVPRLLRALLDDETADEIEAHEMDVRDPKVAAFIGRQVHLATEHYGQLDPLDLQEYIDHGGFQALKRCVKELAPEQIIEAIKASGLRGRGGAGFPTGEKWERLRAARDGVKYIICNGDEGDPGAFMDRMIMESYPFRVLEGMAIAACAVGAAQGWLYIRAEYPLAVQRIREAIRRCEERGILGKSVMGRPFSLDLKIFEGAGAFVCGEETALIASIEGRRGMPRLRPPYPAESGLDGMPTLINNVETYALVPWIVRNGPEKFAAFGTARSKGTKVFALSGKIARGGLIEVPMGISIREIVEEIGGGVAAGRSFKAVQVGGPSGGCIPAELGDTPVDYDALTSVGAIMGSGGLVVLDDSTCMVDMARYFVEFTQDQSCGKCTYCRIGTRRMLDILNRLCAGQGRPDDLEVLEDLALRVKEGSLCGLGKTAPNPVLTTIRYFRGEYEAHLGKSCPAKRCKALITYSVTEKCIGCTLCAQHCPADAIPMTPYRKHEIDSKKCTRCNTCVEVCPSDAIEVK